MYATCSVQARGHTPWLYQFHSQTAFRPAILCVGSGGTLRKFVDSTLIAHNVTTVGVVDGHSEMTIAIMMVVRAHDEKLLSRILSVASQLGSRSRLIVHQGVLASPNEDYSAGLQTQLEQHDIAVVRGQSGQHVRKMIALYMSLTRYQLMPLIEPNRY